METNEILEGNKLIAEFMKAKNENSDIYYLPEFGHYFSSYGQIEYNECFRSNELKYHSSWDWLMPCVGKILIGSYTLEGVYRMRKVRDCLITCYIEKTFNSVCDFIKWYNLNNK